MGRMWYKVNFFKQVKIVLNYEFSCSQNCYITKAKEPSLPIFLLLGGNRCIDVKWNAVLCRIWTQVTEFIICNDNRYDWSASQRQFNVRKYKVDKKQWEHLPFFFFF